MLTNWMNFRKGSKWQLTLNPPFRMVPNPGNHAHSLHTIQPSYLRAYTQPFLSQKFCNINSENEEGLNFSENSSDLVAGPLPKNNEHSAVKQWPKPLTKNRAQFIFFYQNTCNNNVINSFFLVFKSFQGPFVQNTGKKLNIPKTMEIAKDICMMQKVKNIISDHCTMVLFV